MLIQFLRGNLPWQGAEGANKWEKYQKILEVKLLTIDEILCKDLPGTSLELTFNRTILQILEVCEGLGVR
jgi:hypothetical protein